MEMVAIITLAGLCSLLAFGIALVCQATFLVALGWGLIVFVAAFFAFLIIAAFNS